MSLSTQAPLTTVKPIETPAKTARPPTIDPIATATVGPRDMLHIHIANDQPLSASLAPTPSSDFPTSPPPSTPSSGFSHHHHHHHSSSEKCASPPTRRRPLSRRQSSISYLPADSPRLWAPRTPILGSSSLKRSASLSSASNVKKDARAVTGPIHQRPGHEPTVLTLAEKCVSLTFYHSHSLVIITSNKKKKISLF
jgi:hypothetical protein